MRNHKKITAISSEQGGPILARGARLHQTPANPEPTPGANYETFRKGIENDVPEIAVIVLLGLTTVACYFLQKQLEALEEAFLKESGLR